MQQPGATLLEAAQGALNCGLCDPPKGLAVAWSNTKAEDESERDSAPRALWGVAGLTLAPEHCHGCLSPVNMPGVVADLHCKAVHKAPVGSDPGPDPAVPSGPSTSTELCRWQGDGREPLTEVCAVTARLALRMHTPCSASTALGCPGSAPPLAPIPSAGLKDSRGMGQCREILLPFCPKWGMAEQGFCLPHARVVLRFFSA